MSAPDANPGNPIPSADDHAVVRPDRVVDARGAYCPGPLMELIKILKAQPVGSVVELWSSDRGSSKDVPEWVRKARHDLLYLVEETGYWRIGVRKAH
ncbi:MAG: sulfurtransferase TusA family protein [Firmicutes bacterium]|uniref:Sulfurtransferase TusA family protein n=1 Tax=Geochorda subterranea TaxID=3109564 RepID=A0ABZ1BQI7_9FIRM|nr:sulfurtransferase TusA family protein [Limnochorda sp. LNt]NLG70059.1 sulfurtransferase TusA family protein [Bacillota bacterium]WRP15070.1 sulfurtransferase TusA family protein [Limnochorda sp. LNt]